jgi:predicted HAD superfamily Cof-like phosphohydrolase
MSGDTWVEDVLAFHHKMRAPVSAGFGADVIARRAAFIREEAREVQQAFDELADNAPGAAEHLAQELVDLVWVTLGAFVELGIVPAPVWKAVRQANMTKEPAPDPGKAIKGSGWEPPSIILRPIAG